jgi:hypothetical protein
MDEIRLLKGSEPLTVEIERPDSPPSSSSPTVDPGPPEPQAYEPSPVEHRIEDRRVAQRYRAVEGRCWVGWQDGVGFRQSAAWILDISVSGSLIATDAPPPTNRTVWLRLDNPSVPEWAETRVIDLQASKSGIYAARLVFRGACPYAFIKAVAFSTGPQSARPGPSSSWNLNAW